MEKKVPPESAEPPILDNHSAPEILVSQVVRCDIEPGGIVKLTFMSAQFDQHSKAIAQVVNLRLAMSVPCADNMIDFVGNWLAGVKATLAPPPPGTTAH